MYLQANIYNWILKKKWNGLDNIEDIVETYFPLYREKYLHPFEQVSKDTIISEMRKKLRFNIPGISIEIETDEGMKKFRLLDLSEDGLSFMITGDIKFFRRYQKHYINVTICGEICRVVAEYRHLTLIHAKRPYHKYGVEFIKGKDEIKRLLIKNSS